MWIAADPFKGLGTVVANGHCMRHVQVIAGVPHSSHLRRGVRVRDADDVPRGTVIATFNAAGRYGNAMDGSSHIAILLAKQVDGLLVVDQWVGQRVHERLIRYRGGQGSAVNDGDQFYIAEGPETAATA
jgi:hypothetical protein